MDALSPSPRRILVTGGAGFLGAHLCTRLLADGHEVVCLDDLSTGNLGNVAPLQDHPRFSFVEQDVTRTFTCEVDAIYNMASPASPPLYQSDPIKTARTAAFGTMRMLDLADHLGCPMLQASTSEVYGDPQVHPQTESYWGHVNPTGPRACYDEGKRFAETLAFDYHRQDGVRVKVARIFNTYGPMMHPDDGRVVSNFIKQALLGQDITIYGDGSQTRSFCYVSDLIDGLVRLMETPDDVTGPINIGNPVENTIRELAEMIMAKTNATGTLTFRNLPQDDPLQRCPDISRAKDVLGWAPKVPLSDGLDRTIQHFRGIFDAA